MQQKSLKNKYIVRILLISILIIAFSWPCYTQAPERVPKEIEVGNRKFDQAEIENYLEDSDFSYLENSEPRTNYIEKMKSWIYKMLRRLIGNSATELVLGNIHYILMAVALFLIVYKISGLSLESFGYGVKKVDPLQIDFDETPIDQIDFQLLIRDALAANDFRLAIRYQYLDVLKSLSELGLISHSHFKSNIEYTYELKNQALKDEFRQLVFAFDHVWYGEYNVDELHYKQINKEFDTFKGNIPKNPDSSVEK